MTVRVASSDNPDVTVAPAVLTFTGGAGGNWNTAQAVTVHAGADDNGVGETVPVTHTVTSGDASYHGLETRAAQQVPGRRCR